MLGVVNGVYAFDPEETFTKMSKYDNHLSPEQIKIYSQRHVVRVGIDREHWLAAFSPIVLGKFSDFVLLPEGWTHDMSEISEDRTIVNVGDVVEIKGRKGRLFDHLNRIVRKCSMPPEDNENKDWNIGCKTYDGFNEQGFAGEQYLLRQF